MVGGVRGKSKRSNKCNIFLCTVVPLYYSIKVRKNTNLSEFKNIIQPDKITWGVKQECVLGRVPRAKSRAFEGQISAWAWDSLPLCNSLGLYATLKRQHAEHMQEINARIRSCFYKFWKICLHSTLLFLLMVNTCFSKGSHQVVKCLWRNACFQRTTHVHTGGQSCTILEVKMPFLGDLWKSWLL